MSGPWSLNGQGVKTTPERELKSRGKHACFSVKPWGDNWLVFRTEIKERKESDRDGGTAFPLLPTTFSQAPDKS